MRRRWWHPVAHCLGLYAAASASAFLCNHFMDEPHASALHVLGIAFAGSVMGMLQIVCHARLSGRWK